MKLRINGGWAVFVILVLVVAGGQRYLVPVTAVDERAREPVLEELHQFYSAETLRTVKAGSPGSVTIDRAREVSKRMGAVQQIKLAELKGRRAGENRIFVQAQFSAIEADGHLTESTRYFEVQTRYMGSWQVMREISSWRWRLAAIPF